MSLALGIYSISVREAIIASIFSGFGQKNKFFKELLWLKVNNLAMDLGKALKLNSSVETWSKLKSRKFLGIMHTFREVTKEKLAGKGGLFAAATLNRVNDAMMVICTYKHAFVIWNWRWICCQNVRKKFQLEK